MSMFQRIFSCFLFLLIPLHNADRSATKAAEPEHDKVSHRREVSFELTFANQDMIWLGDPASPTSSVYLKPNARPIATDLCVSTIVEDNVSAGRRYYGEARIAIEDDLLKVYAYTPEREKLIGTIDERGRFSPNKFYHNNRDLLPSWPDDTSILAYDTNENALYHKVDVPGPLVSETLDFLPLKLFDNSSNPVLGRYSIQYETSEEESDSKEAGTAILALEIQGNETTIAKAGVPKIFRREDVQLGSYDNGSGTYLPETAYRAKGVGEKDVEPSVTVTIAGEFPPSIVSDGERLVLVNAPMSSSQREKTPPTIVIDGAFDDWRNVVGVDDPRGDVVPYLEYIPDVDLLEFKVAHDDRHIYLYARVAGQVGRSHPDGGRSYFYAYMDVDQNPGTGFLPTRDDDCYFGVDIGDDCEVQFEFVNNALRKTFYGFCGIGGNENVLKQEVTIGKSQYGRFNENGVERENYKSEYIYHDGITEITEDLKLGTSDTIHLAVSPDGREVEVVSTYSGFLKDANGQPTVQPGQTIDLAVGMECDSKAYPDKRRWAADSTIAIRGYKISPSK